LIRTCLLFFAAGLIWICVATPTLVAIYAATGGGIA
jgi:hypothetical protein